MVWILLLTKVTGTNTRQIMQCKEAGSILCIMWCNILLFQRYAENLHIVDKSFGLEKYTKKKLTISANRAAVILSTCFLFSSSLLNSMKSFLAPLICVSIDFCSRKNWKSWKVKRIIMNQIILLQRRNLTHHHKWISEEYLMFDQAIQNSWKWWQQSTIGLGLHQTFLIC